MKLLCHLFLCHLHIFIFYTWCHQQEVGRHLPNGWKYTRWGNWEARRELMPFKDTSCTLTSRFPFVSATPERSSACSLKTYPHSIYTTLHSLTHTHTHTISQKFQNSKWHHNTLPRSPHLGGTINSPREDSPFGFIVTLLINISMLFISHLTLLTM